MNTQKTNTSRRRKAAIAISALLIAALLLTGTYAWNYYGEHKTNASGKLDETVMFDVRLIEDFQSNNDWRIEEPTLPKKLSVINMGVAEQGFSPAYVRLLLKEYMEITPETVFEYYTDAKGVPIRFLIGHDDDFRQAGYSGAGMYICFDDPATAASYYNEPERQIVWLTDAVTGQTGWFVSSMQKDLNGQYGRYVATNIIHGTPTSIVADSGLNPGDFGYYVNTNQGREAWLAPIGNHQPQSNGECLYPATSVSDQIDSTAVSPTLPIRDYIDIVFNSVSVMMPMKDFYGAPNYGNPIDRWIYDETGSDPHIYWGQPLNPGDETHDLTAALELLRQPGAGFYYAMHVDMESQLEPWPAPGPRVVWQRSYGSNSYDYGTSLVAWHGGYLGVGGISGRGRDVTVYGYLSDAWWFTTGADGILQTQTTDPDGMTDYWKTIRATADGGTIRSGRAGGAGYGAWIIKTDVAGAVQWEQKLHVGPNDDIWAYDAVDLAEVANGYFILSYTQSGSSNWVTKLDLNGNVVWDAKILHRNGAFGQVNMGALDLTLGNDPIYIDRFDNTIVVCSDTAMSGSPPLRPHSDIQNATSTQFSVWTFDNIINRIQSETGRYGILFDKIFALDDGTYLIAGAGVAARVSLPNLPGQAVLISYLAFNATDVPSRIVRQNGEILFVGASGTNGWLANMTVMPSSLSFAWSASFGNPTGIDVANDVAYFDGGYTVLGHTSSTSASPSPLDPDLTASGGPGHPKTASDTDFWMVRLAAY